MLLAVEEEAAVATTVEVVVAAVCDVEAVERTLKLRNIGVTGHLSLGQKLTNETKWVKKGKVMC